MTHSGSGRNRLLRSASRETRTGAVGFIRLALFLPIAAVQLIAAPNPPFSFTETDGKRWLVDPGGTRIFSFGVCVISQGPERSEYAPTNPSYAAFKYYSDSNQWAKSTVDRLKSWQFTTIGGWSDYAALRGSRTAGLMFTPVLHVGSTAGVPWWDMWDTNIIARMHQIAREQILPLRDDPRLLGYYSDNEMGWWNATLFRMTLEQSPASGQRQRLIQLLRETYHDRWTELLKDFEPEQVDSFDQLQQRGMLYLRPGSNGIFTYRRFLSLMAERYYSLVRQIIRTYDPRGLILGDRYQSFYYPEVARACAQYVDAVSANLNAGWNDGTFPRFYLETLHSLTSKPMFVSEFYMAAKENRSGNQNKPGTFPTVLTQKERAKAFLRTVHELLRFPAVVGADWFQYCDEPTYGRADGENYNFGLVDIENRPYELLTRAASSLDVLSLKARHYTLRPDATLGVPPAPPKPLANFAPTLALKHWDRERGFLPPSSELPLADFYLCWNRKAIYLGLFAQDITEEAFYRTKAIPESDRSQWNITINGTNAIRARLGGGRAPVCDRQVVRLETVSGAYINTRNIAALEIPAALVGKRYFTAGDSIDLASTYFTHCQANRTDWKARLVLR